MEYSEFERLFCENLHENGLDCFATADLAAKFYRLTSLLSAANEQMNLTAIRKPADMIPLHYADCLLAARYLPDSAIVLDCGCGGGFPTLPLAIARPDLRITALDSTAKKLGFVRSAAETLGLSNVTTLCGRAEELGCRPEYREKFDACCARAVAALPVLSELCIPFVKVGGIFLAMKGSKAQEEFDAAGSALNRLGCTQTSIEIFLLDTQIASESRGIILAHKNLQTPSQFPRNYAQILKKPL